MNPGSEDVKVWKKTYMTEFHEVDEEDDVLGSISPQEIKDEPVENAEFKEGTAIPPPPN